MNLTEKVAYLRGMADGMNINDSSNEGKLISNIIDMLDDIVTEVTSLKSDIAAMKDVVITDDEEDFDGDVYEMTCPSCGATFEISEDELNLGEVACPHCGEVLEFDLENTSIDDIIDDDSGDDSSDDEDDSDSDSDEEEDESDPLVGGKTFNEMFSDLFNPTNSFCDWVDDEDDEDDEDEN